MKPLTVAEAQDLIERHAPTAYYRDEYRKGEDCYLSELCARLEEWLTGEGKDEGMVLEVGPGWGTLAVWLMSRGQFVAMVDMMPLGTWISAQHLEEWRQLVEGGGVVWAGCSYAQTDVHDAERWASMAYNQYPLVVMTQVIPHLKFRADGALQNVRRAVAPGGLFIMQVLDRDQFPHVITPYRNWREVPEAGEPCPEIVPVMYDEADFRDLLEASDMASALVERDGCVLTATWRG